MTLIILNELMFIVANFFSKKIIPESIKIIKDGIPL